MYITIDLSAHRFNSWISLYQIPNPDIVLQKYQNRLVVVKPAEMIHWKQLTLEYMTEESDDPEDDNVIIEHKLQWRSESKCCFMQYVCEYTY